MTARGQWIASVTALSLTAIGTAVFALFVWQLAMPVFTFLW